MSEGNQIQMTELPAVEKPSKPVVPYPVNHVDKVFAGVMFLLAFLAVDSFGIFMNHADYGLGVTVYTFLYGAACLSYAKLSGQRIGKEAVFWFGVMGLSAVSYAFVYHQTLMVFQALFLRLVSLYFTAVVFGALITGQTSEFFLWDGINLLVLIPSANWKAQWTAVRDSGKYDRLISVVSKAFMGLVVAIPLFWVVIRLLSGADANFGNTLGQLLDHIWERVDTWGIHLLLAVPVGSYLFALCYGAAHKRETDKIRAEEIRRFCNRCAVVPRVSIYTVLIGICLLYMLFIGLQGGYYLDAVRGVLPEEFTYSEYARKGFFELVNISMLNVCIILASRLLCQKGGKLLMKIGTVGISVLTLFLIGTAMTKMFLYIRVYGLTPLRVIPSLFMGFLVVVFLLIIVAQFKKIQVVPVAVGVFAIGYAVLSVSNIDGRIAAYNLARYQAGTLESFPADVLVEGSLASVPAMYRLWSSTEDPEVKALVAETADIIAGRYRYGRKSDASFLGTNMARHRGIEYLSRMETAVSTSDSAADSAK